MAVVSKATHKQRAVYFPFQIGKMFWNIELEDLSNLIVNAVKWAGYDSDPEVAGPTTLHVSLTEKENHTMVHLINLTGGRHVFRQLIPLRDIEVTLKQEGIEEAFLLSSGEKLPVKETGDGLRVTVKMLKDYDVVVFRRK